jgi:hypothetical protein
MRLVSALKRRLGEGRERRLREQQALTERLTALIEGLSQRLDNALFASVLEYAGQTEWELAIDVIRTEMRNGRLVLEATEVAELEVIERSPLLTRAFLPPESVRT